MEQNYFSIPIPTELKQYQKIVDAITPMENEEKPETDFGVKLIKNTSGYVSEAHYYSDTGDLLKKIFYQGSTVCRIEHFRYKKMRSQETYRDGRLQRKSIYNRDGQLVSSINYEYNRKDLITVIRKVAQEKRYEVLYDYDELGRPNGRILRMNSKTLDTQKFRYDIIDRIVEYEDSNQNIKVHKVNTKNELVKYTITDKIGNSIDIYNKFLCSDYIATEIDLNGHKTIIKDSSYLGNALLKKPYASEDDLDLAMSNIFNKDKYNYVARKHNTDITNMVINKNMNNNVLPISIRKMQLIKKAV